MDLKDKMIAAFKKGRRTKQGGVFGDYYYSFINETTWLSIYRSSVGLYCTGGAHLKITLRNKDAGELSFANISESEFEELEELHEAPKRVEQSITTNKILDKFLKS